MYNIWQGSLLSKKRLFGRIHMMLSSASFLARFFGFGTLHGSQQARLFCWHRGRGLFSFQQGSFNLYKTYVDELMTFTCNCMGPTTSLTWYWLMEYLSDNIPSQPLTLDRFSQKLAVFVWTSHFQDRKPSPSNSLPPKTPGRKTLSWPPWPWFGSH